MVNVGKQIAQFFIIQNVVKLEVSCTAPINYKSSSELPWKK